MRRPRNLLRNLEASNELTGLTHEDSLLLVVPLYFVRGRMQLLYHAMLGATVHFSAGFQFPQRVLQELDTSEVTGVSGVPFHFRQLMRRSKMAKTPLPKLRHMLITGEALRPDEQEKLAEAVPNVELQVGYDQTEAAPRISSSKAKTCLSDVARRTVCFPASRSISSTRWASLRATASSEKCWYRAPTSWSGTCRAPSASGIIEEQGRLHTGDLGRFDADSFLYLEGRSSEMIKTAGERLFPNEVEEAVARLDAVREVAVDRSARADTR